MRRTIFGVCIFLLATGCSGEKGVFTGTAEDLWGNRVDLDDHPNGLTLIQPFSPANCGYCLIDAEYVHLNYMELNARTGGRNFHQCLFNPQLDIYTYMKHFRIQDVPVIVSPVSLHRFHRNGFPSLIAFRNGDLLFRGSPHPYEEKWHEVSDSLWPGEKHPLRLAAGLHMAYRFINENKAGLTTWVVPDGDTERYTAGVKRLEGYRDRNGFYHYESNLTTEDLEKNVCFTGPCDAFHFRSLAGKDLPITIDSTHCTLGEYRFPRSETALQACSPNPYNSERYIAFDLSGPNGMTTGPKTYVDYAAAVPGEDGKPRVLLEGFFGKEEKNRWSFCDSLAFPGPEMNDYCKGGSCPVPTLSGPPWKTHELDLRTTRNGETWILGAENCRFPDITVDEDGHCWTTWEEDGDILLTACGGEEPETILAVESDDSDSFHPIVACDGKLTWVFYLNERDGFYRLYGKYYDGTRLSDPIRISDRGPWDVITPAVASDANGTIVLAWSEWKVNWRFLRYRTIRNRVPGEVRAVEVVPAGIYYQNGWYPSLDIDEDGTAWAAWNQHYPASLGVCAGNLESEAASVTRLGERIQDCEKGGYPSIAVAANGERWVVWESYGWDVFRDTPQKIYAARWDEPTNGWSLPWTLTVENGTYFNRAPKTASDKDGGIHAVWTGRDRACEKPWGVYTARLLDGTWSEPRLVSEPEESARAPEIAVGPDGTVWAAWHTGSGEKMRVKVVRLP